MKPGRTFWRIIIAATAILAFAVAQYCSVRGKLVTDVFALFTDLTASDADRAAMKEVVSREGRVIAFRLEGPQASKDARILAGSLVESGAAQRAEVANQNSFAGIGRTLFENRMTLLFPRFLAEEKSAYEASGAVEPFEEWFAERAVANLDGFLATPQSPAFSALIPQDPLLLLPPCADALPPQATGGTVVLGEVSGPSTDGAVQEKLIKETERLRGEFSGHGTKLHATGAAYFAHESEARIRADVARLNLAMTAMLLVFMLYYLRSVATMIAVALPVLISWMLAIIALFLFEPQVYAIALGIGGILGGISVDCPVHIMLHRKPGETSHVPAYRRLLKPIALGALASISVFAFLLFSELPLVRQTGLLVGCGLALSYFAILPSFAAFPPRADPATVSRRLEVFSISEIPHIIQMVTLFLAALALGAFRLGWNDSTDALQPPLDALYEENAFILGNAAKGDGNEYVVSFGESFSGAVDNARKLHSEGLASRLATEEEALDAAQWIAASGTLFESALKAKLAGSGYDEEAFAPLFREELADYEAALRQLGGALPAGLGWMLSEEGRTSWIVSRIPVEQAASLTPDCRSYRLDVRGQLREVFRGYRGEATRLALFGFAIASLVILASCGIRRGLHILAIPVLSIAATFGVFGLFGAGISLFNIIGMLLGYGLSMDYALFASHPESGRASIRFSACTTMTAFAALVISVIPAVRMLGLSVLLVLFFTLLQCEARPLSKTDEPD